MHYKLLFLFSVAFLDSFLRIVDILAMRILSLCADKLVIIICNVSCFLTHFRPNWIYLIQTTSPRYSFA